MNVVGMAAQDKVVILGFLAIMVLWSIGLIGFGFVLGMWHARPEHNPLRRRW